MESYTKVVVVLDRKDLMQAKTKDGIVVSLPPSTTNVQIYVLAEVKINGE